MKKKKHLLEKSRKKKGRCVDVNKSHDDNNGGGQRENVESAFDKSQADMSRK